MTSAARAGGPAALLALAALVGCGASEDAAPVPRTTPILVVGVDGLDWSVALPLIRRGRMPQLEALMRRGVAGRLETIAPAKSPVIWTSVATGRLPAEHGILDFTRDNDGRKHLYTSADRRTKALWNIVSDAGRRAFVVSWWNTFPAEEIGGVVVAQANTLEQIARRRMLKPGGLLRGVAGQVHPAERHEEILALAEEVDRAMPGVLAGIFGEIGETGAPGDRANLDACAWSVRADESTRRVALRLASEPGLPDLFAVYLGTPDVVSHRFWRFHEPEAFEHPPDAEAVERFGHVIEDAYASSDAALGDLVAALPAETTIVVLSDHGMHAHNTSSQFDVPVGGRLERESGGHEDGPPGLFVAAGPGIRDAGLPRPLEELVENDLPVVGHALDLTPTLLTLLGLPVGRDMDGVVLESLLEPQLPVTYVETHDTEDWLASRPTVTHETPGTEERLEQLRSLGYIGD
jgi:hypothetical protein